MGILLSLFIGFSTPIMPIPIIFNSESSDLATVYKKDTINLNELKVNDLNLDLNYLYNKDPAPTEDEIKEAILIGIASNNDASIYEIMISILTEKEKWKISGINFEIPKLGETHNYDAKFFSLDTSKYIGVLSVKITLSNTNNVQDLNDVILNLNLNTIENPDNIEVLKILKEKNSSLDINEISIKDLTYKNAIIKANENSSKYIGSVIVSFTSTIKLNGDTWESQYISLSSYSGPETKTDNKEFNYQPTLGKLKFIDNFNKIKIKFSGTAITSRPQWVNNFFNSEIKEITINSDSSKNDFWYYEQQWYGNFDASSAWLETSWKNTDDFVLKFVAWAKVDSSAISTDYSKAKTQLIIEEISFE